MTYEEALQWIHGRLKFGTRPGLHRIIALLEKLGNPQDKIKTVHVAGTNGKGSTVTFLNMLLQEKGLKVGTFTSPYIERFNERICLNSEQISDEDLVRWVKKIKPLVMELDRDEALSGITEFEIITALMYDYFFEKKIDIGIIEVGLGGLLDSTNVITPLLSIITTIGYDHLDILGDTLGEIAAQKAGIIKKQRPVIVGRMPKEAYEVIKKVAVEKESPVYTVALDFFVEYGHPIEPWGEQFTFKRKNFSLDRLEIGLLGKHQTDNASLAIEASLQLGAQLNFSLQESEIRRALKAAFWPGRMEKIADEPMIILDGAHNEPAVQVLVENVKKEFAGKDIYILFAALTTKNVQGMLTLLQKIPREHLYLTQFDYPKAVSSSMYQSMAIKEPVLITEYWQEALQQIVHDVSSEDVILITGSLYFISQVRTFLFTE